MTNSILTKIMLFIFSRLNKFCRLFFKTIVRICNIHSFTKTYRKLTELAIKLVASVKKSFTFWTSLFFKVIPVHGLYSPILSGRIEGVKKEMNSSYFNRFNLFSLRAMIASFESLHGLHASALSPEARELYHQYSLGSRTCPSQSKVDLSCVEALTAGTIPSEELLAFGKEKPFCEVPRVSPKLLPKRFLEASQLDFSNTSSIANGIMLSIPYLST